MTKEKIKKITIIFVILLIAIGGFAIISMASEVNGPSQVQFEMRLNTTETPTSSYVTTSDGTQCYKNYGDITVAVDLYLKTPKANLTECNLLIKEIDSNNVNNTNQSLKPVSGTHKISAEVNSLRSYIQIKDTNLGPTFEFNSNGDENISLTSDGELKLATFYFKIDNAYQASPNKKHQIACLKNSVKRNNTNITTDINNYYLYTTDEVDEVIIENQTVKTTTGKDVNIAGGKVTLEAGDIIKVNAIARDVTSVAGEYLTDNLLQEFTYESDNTGVVEILSDGSIKVIRAGTTNVGVYSLVNHAMGRTLEVTVTGGVEINSLSITNKDAFNSPIKLGQELNLDIELLPANANINTLIFKSSNDKVATVSQDGKVKAVGLGNAEITVTDNNGHTDKVTVNVENPVTKIEILNPTSTISGNSYHRLQVNVAPSEYTNKIKYKSSNTSVATINAEGIIHGVSLGTTTITAYYGDVEDSFIVNVVSANLVVGTQSINITNKQKTILVGEQYAINAQIKPDNASNKLIKYFSSDESVATVDNNGNVTALNAGDVTITAKQGSLSSTIDLKVITAAQKVPVTGISINENLVFEVDKMYDITISPEPSNTTGSVSIVKVEPVDESTLNIHDVTADGFKLQTKKVGKSNIIITAKDNEGNTFTKTEQITTCGVSFAETSFVRVNEGATYQIKPLITELPANEEIEEITYKSSEPQCVTVDNNGLVHAISTQGSSQKAVSITAELKTKSGKVYKSESLAITITSIKIVLDKNEVELLVGDEFNVGFTTEPRIEYPTYEYSSSDNTVLEHLGDTYFKAKKEGYAEITVTETFYNIKAVCKVYVVNQKHTQKEIIPAVPSTCTVQGHGEYEVCKICHEAVIPGADALLPLDPNNHVGQTIVKNAINATTKTAGYTGDTYCLDCGEIIQRGEFIPKLEEEKIKEEKEVSEEKQEKVLDKKEAESINNEKDDTPKTGKSSIISYVLFITILSGMGIVILNGKTFKKK